MKRFIALILVTLLVQPGLTAEPPESISSDTLKTLAQANETRLQQMFEANLGYRKAIASTFKHADRVEVFLIDYAKSDGEGFLIPSLSKEAQILRRRVIPASDVRKWCDAVTTAIAAETRPTRFAGCYMPVHGIRIYSNDTLLFETAICWKCNNYDCAYFVVSDSQLETFPPGVRDDLKSLFDEALPITKEIETRLKRPATKSN